MTKQTDMKSYLKKYPAFEDITCSLRATVKQPRGMYKETRKVIAIARKFNDEVISKYNLEMDRTMQENPDFLPWDLVRIANEWGFFSMWIPKMFGGHGYNIPSIAYFMEETGSACVGLSNLICVHYLAITAIFSTWNLKVVNKLCRMIAEGEKKGIPCLLSTAITEPGAGTDMEEVELVDKANLGCFAKRVDGGYVINGSKIFISNGHVATWHIVTCFMEGKKPTENALIAAVKTGSKGFRFGRAEHKMGVKICPASELIFDDCFVSDDMVLSHPHDADKQKRGAFLTNSQTLDYVLATSRAGVGAWGTGAARGAFETALDYALTTDVNGKLLANHEWAQCMLAEMYRNVSIGRMSYETSNYSLGMYGMMKAIQFKPLYYYFKFMPKAVLSLLLGPLFNLPVTTWFFKKLQMDWQTDDEIHRTAGLGSLAKFTGTDMGIINCQMAMELMGQSGLRHDRRAEKILRDSKLLQIYEGTNQLNRVNLFKCLVAPGHSKVRMFEQD